MSHHREHRTGDESYPERIALPQTKAFACHDLTLREAALLARERVRASRRVQRAEPKLARLGERLAMAALRAAEPSPVPVDPAPATVRAGERPAPGGVIPRSGFGITVVTVPCVAIVLTAYLCLSAGAGELPLPAAFLALVVLLVMCPAHASRCSGGRNCTRSARAAARHENDSGKRALALRCEYHRAWLALEAEVNRLLVDCHRGDELPEVRVILKPSLRLLEQYRPTVRMEVNP